MTDRELMQMALDALSMAVEPKKGKVYAFEFQPIDCDAMYLKAIEALRARLEKWTVKDTAYRPGGLPQSEQELVAWARVNMNDHKEGDLGIGATPYAAQAAMVAGQTQGRMYVDPVTGDVGIGNPNQVTLDTSGATGFKLDASAPLVVHPHPAFQAPPPQREWQGLTDEEIRGFEIWLDDEEEKHGWNPPADIVKYIEAKLKEKNHE